ncbi:Pol polyprotein [Labeo rohita]|uniref:ribonuclease H n=1 Tax=Labeo rohita TaxID=84645 RepID=A0ABQ8M100_LABRO|nr:Pol polyprotein [Labeo rohita]
MLTLPKLASRQYRNRQIKHILPQLESTKPPGARSPPGDPPAPSTPAPPSATPKEATPQLGVKLAAGQRCSLLLRVPPRTSVRLRNGPRPGDGGDCSSGESKLCVLFTSVCLDIDASVLCAEIAALLAKDAIKLVPFYSPYFIVPKKSSGLRPILDLRALNRPLHRLPFKMLMVKCILSCIRHQHWLAAIDLKDAYFHVSILPRHRPFLRFAFEGQAYQYKVLPFGLALSSHVFTKLVDELDSVYMTACLTDECAQSVLNCLNLFRHKTVVPLKLFQRLLGHMAAAVTPFGLLHMRLLQHWLHGRIPRWAWHRSTGLALPRSITAFFSPWSDPAFLRQEQAASGSWTGPQLQWHNCLKLLAVFLTLRWFLLMLRDRHVLVRMNNIATVVYINHQSGLHSRRVPQLARHLLL